MKHLMDEGDRDRTFSNCGRYALGVAAPNVAGREDSRQTRLE